MRLPFVATEQLVPSVASQDVCAELPTLSVLFNDYGTSPPQHRSHAEGTVASRRDRVPRQQGAAPAAEDATGRHPRYRSADAEHDRRLTGPAASAVVPDLPVLLVSGFARLEAQEAERLAFLQNLSDLAALSKLLPDFLTRG